MSTVDQSTRDCGRRLFGHRSFVDLSTDQSSCRGGLLEVSVPNARQSRCKDRLGYWIIRMAIDVRRAIWIILKVNPL